MSAEEAAWHDEYGEIGGPEFATATARDVSHLRFGPAAGGVSG
jgi:hypothetical protein